VFKDLKKNINTRRQMQVMMAGQKEPLYLKKYNFWNETFLNGLSRRLNTADEKISEFNTASKITHTKAKGLKI
jgi:hypothetical protein